MERWKNETCKCEKEERIYGRSMETMVIEGETVTGREREDEGAKANKKEFEKNLEKDGEDKKTKENEICK